MQSLRTTMPHILPAPARMLRLVRDWRSLRRERLALARLDARLLDDIGIGAGAARDEAAKPFWQD